MKKLLHDHKLQAACPKPFDEAKLWKGQNGPELMKQIQSQFKNIRFSVLCFRQLPFFFQCSFVLFFSLYNLFYHSFFKTHPSWTILTFCDFLSFGRLINMQCTDGLCGMWKVSPVGQASGPGTWDCIKNLVHCQWRGTICSACKFFIVVVLYHLRSGIYHSFYLMPLVCDWQ